MVSRGEEVPKYSPLRAGVIPGSPVLCLMNSLIKTSHYPISFNPDFWGFPKVLRRERMLLLGEVFLMVYCQKCGTENADTADFCKKCGTALAPKTFEKRAGRRVGERAEEECFGVTGGGAIFGIIFGVIIVGLGYSLVLGIHMWLLIGPIIALIIGVLILLCALNSIRRKRSIGGQE